MRKLPVNQLHARDELIVDLFAGGGGASTGIEQALGRSPDVAVNHDAEAIAMHCANHPRTRHYRSDVFEVDPVVVCRGKPVGLLWMSPDCTHHSKARGGKPIREAGRKSRALAWVAIKWAETVRPRVICLENVEEFQEWGPLSRDGRPCAKRKGATFRSWRRSLERLGYRVEFRELRACDYGAPTIRKRLFLVARCDGRPIVWPEPTHGKPSSCNQENGLLPWRTAADIIDWSIPCHSIFLTPEEARRVGVRRPLKESTLKRIARGLKKFVIDCPKPFIVPITHSGSDRVHSIDEPLRTVTTANGGEFSLVAPVLETRFSNSSHRSPESPLPTVMATGQGKQGLITAFLSAYYGTKDGADLRNSSNEEPVRTQTTENRFSLVSAFMAQHNAGDNNVNSCGRSADSPLSTITTRGTQQNVVSAFLQTYYGQGDGQVCDDPLRTVVTKERFGLVTIGRIDFQIIDIGMRMLAPRELYRAQGFPDSYFIDVVHDGKRLSKTSQVRMCGNSVCPQMAQVLVAANCPELAAKKRTRKFQREFSGV